MIVLDASAAIELLLDTTAGLRIGGRIAQQRDVLCTVHLLDVEFANALRRMVRSGIVAPARAEEAITDLSALRISRYPSYPLLHRIWELRHNLTAYDAAYVALAEVLKAPLITRDGKLAAAPGHSAAIEVF